MKETMNSNFLQAAADILPKLSAGLMAALALLWNIPAGADTPSAQQTLSYMQDIYNWSDTEWYGSARTLGMGNAVTATGGDIGTMAINPAGGAVAPYSQVSVTPGVSISATTSQGIQSSDGNSYLSSSIGADQSKFILPNAGFIIHFNTDQYTTLKGFSVGFLANMAKNYNCTMTARGENPTGTSTLAGSLAWQATDMGGTGAEGSLTDLAWNADIIGLNESLKEDSYFGVDEWMKNISGSDTRYLETDLSQRFSSHSYGDKEDYIFNASFNLLDMIYLGASLGISTLSYSMNQNLYESNLLDKTMTHNAFQELNWSYSYSCSGAGVYGKFGVIVCPVGGLRIGLAVQTPTCFNMSENYSNNVSNIYSERSIIRNYSTNDVRYKATTPLRLNGGLAYTFGSTAVLSADYEMADYSQCRYGAAYAEDEVWFETVNEQIQGAGRYSNGSLGISHTLRVGAEVKPIPCLALRAGYNYMTCGTRFAENTAESNTQSASFGIGWSSPRSFYVDAAARWTGQPVTYYRPYSDYYTSYSVDAQTSAKKWSGLVGAPVVRTVRNLWTIVLTLGWRF